MNLPKRSERGVGTIEFLLIAPMVFIVLLGVVQVALVTIAKESVEDAARAAAHASRNDESPQVAANRAAGTTIDSVTVQLQSDGAWQARGKVVTVFPGANVTITRSAAMP